MRGITKKLLTIALVIAASAAALYMDLPKGGTMRPKIGDLYLVPNRAYLPMALSLIENATMSIHCVYMYIKDEGDAARFVDALISAKERGVSVSVVLEGDLSEESSSAYTRLRSAGVAVRYDGSGFVHAKFMIVDGRILLIGSHNISPYALGLNNELSVLVENSSIAAVLEGAFADLWEDGVLDEDHTEVLGHVMVVQGVDLPGVLRGILEGAQGNISMMYYTFKYYGDYPPTDDLVHALISAASRGVQVRVYLDSRRTNAITARQLEAGNVSVRQSERVLTHTKLTVVDGRTVLVGDTNLAKSYFYRDTVSFTLVVNDTSLAYSAQAYFNQIWVNGKLLGFPAYAVMGRRYLILVNAGTVTIDVTVRVSLDGNESVEEVTLPPGRLLVRALPSEPKSVELTLGKGEAG